MFILVRIYEGDRTPYYVHNDPNIYTRTGNITDPIDLASPEAVEILFGKKEKAELARNNYIRRANEVYVAAVANGEKQRLKLIAVEKAKYQSEVERAKQQGIPPKQYSSQYYQHKLGSEVSMFTMLLQPYYPKKALESPRKIKSDIDKIRYKSGSAQFPESTLIPIQDGLLNFNHSWIGSISCHELFSNGLMFLSVDVLRQDVEYGRRINIEGIAAYYFILLKAARNYYQYLKYQGSIYGFMRLEAINGAKLKRIVPNGYRSGFFWDEENEVPLMNEYEWKIEIDTSLLNSDISLQNHFISVVQEIYWSLGYEDIPEELLKSFLKDHGWLIETVQV